MEDILLIILGLVLGAVIVYIHYWSKRTEAKNEAENAALSDEEIYYKAKYYMQGAAEQNMAGNEVNARFGKIIEKRLSLKKQAMAHQEKTQQ